MDMAAERGARVVSSGLTLPSEHQWCHLVVAEEQLSLRSSTGSLHTVSSECISHSQLLQELVSAGGDAGVAPVPLSEAAFSMWMHGVDNVAASATAGHKEKATPDSMLSPRPHVPRGAALAAPHVHPMLAYAAAPRLAHILMAADVLIDDTTKNSAAAQLAVLLQQPGAAALLSGEGQVISLLPEHLQMAVFRHVPLADALCHLPSTFHQTALRARHPSIETHHHLQLHRLPPELMHAALTATTAFSALKELSLDGASFPHACESSIGVLQQLSSVTELSLRETGITERMAHAVAAMLPAVPQLARLDLSRNRVTVQVVKALRPGLSRCTALRALSLFRWVAADTCSANAIMQEAAGAVTPLQELTALAYGLDYHSESAQSLGQWEQPTSDLQRALRGMPKLKALELHCPHLQAPAGPRLAEVLLSAPGLHHLHLCLRNDYVAGPMPSLEAVSGRSVGLLALLTSLELSVDTWFEDVAPQEVAPQFMHCVAGLFLLSELRLLSKSSDDPDDLVSVDEHVGIAVAEVLPRLTQLTLLHVMTCAGDGVPLFLVRDAAEQLVIAVAAASQLRELALPLWLCTKDGPLVDRLLAATHLQSLQVQLCLCPQEIVQEMPELVRTLPDCEVAVPLLPYTTLLILRDCHDQGTPLCLQPLVDSRSALGSLRALDVKWEHHRHSSADYNAILNSVSCLTSLQRLEVIGHAMLDLNRHGHREGPLVAYSTDREGIDVERFCHELQGLSALTRLHWDVFESSRHVAIGQAAVMHACRFLPQLQALQLGLLIEVSDFVAAVPQLLLRQLEMVVEVCSESTEAEDVAGVLARMPHLREVHVIPGAGELDLDSTTQSVLMAATSNLPACHIENPESIDDFAV